ncbi:hypothetical protein Hanom_Chr01g00073791 [Helianthus anomalus]
MDLTEKTNPIHSRDYPSNKLSNHKEHGCNFQKLGTKGEILPNHRDYPCILLQIVFKLIEGLNSRVKVSRPLMVNNRGPNR